MASTPKVTIGEQYLSIICANPSCANVIPIAPAGELHLVSGCEMIVGCPFCGESHLYSLGEAKDRKLEKLPPTAH